MDGEAEQELMLTELVCPLCGSGNISLDYTSLVTVKFREGKLEHIHFGGVFEAQSDVLNCHQCGVYEQQATLEQDYTAEHTVHEQVPPAISGGMVDGILIFDEAPGMAYREFTAFGCADGHQLYEEEYAKEEEGEKT